jgi:signal transduction histidine kinase
MAGWSIRRKLAVLVTIPLVVLLVGGGVLVASLTVQYQQTRTASTYADALLPALGTARAFDSEFNNPSALIERTALANARASTDAQIKQLKPYLLDLSKDDPNESNLPNTASTLLNQLTTLSNIRSGIDKQIASDALNASNPVDTGTAVTTVNRNTKALRDAAQAMITTLTGELSVVSPDRTVDLKATFISSMSNLMEAAVAETAQFDRAISGQSGIVDVEQFSDFKESTATQEQSFANAQTVANPEQQSQLTALTNQSARLTTWRDSLTSALNQPKPDIGNLPSWDKFANERLTAINQIISLAATDTKSSTDSAETSALFRTLAVAGAVLLTLLVVSALLAAIARTVTVPLRRLRAGAVEIASVQLPAAVARIEQDGVGADVSLPPVLPADAYAGPETLEVARAVDDLGAEAVRLATAQVRLRRALDEAFVSMSRRSQSMVEKQLAIIDELESQEQDPDQLRNLFRLDHLAARMRRYNDNLLVLAGSAVRTRATAPVKIAELFRAATSEMEQYERVRLQPVSGASIAGTVAGELVHLLAELLDNAAMYSPPSSAIVLSAAFTADGGLQIEVLDAGVGISPGELDRLNGRLTQPEAIDTQVPSRMGLFVVARLARRGSFGVMLQARSDASGTVALVRVPATLVIGAPGSTGEQPVAPPSLGMRPASAAPTGRQATSQYAAYAPPAALNTAPSVQRAPALPPGALSPAAAAAGAAAQAAAGVRSVAEGNAADGNAALPRRRRVAGAGPNAGLPPEAAAAAANPATGLFTPATPPAPIPDDGGDRQRSTGAMGMRRPPAVPPETAPTGITGLPNRNRDLPTRGQDFPTGSMPTRGHDVPLRAQDLPTGSMPTGGLPTGGLPTRGLPNRGQDQANGGLPTRGPGAATGGLPVRGQQSPAAPQPWDAPPFSAQPAPWDAPPFSAQPTYQREQAPTADPQPAAPDTGQSLFDTPAAGITGLPGLAPPVRRGPGAPLPTRPGIGRPDSNQPGGGQNDRSAESQPFQDPLTTPTGLFRAPPNPSVPTGPPGNEGNSNGWDENLPTELAARAAAAAGYRPSEPNLPMIGENVSPDFNDPTPIFDQISVWFTAEPDSSPAAAQSEGEQVIDLRTEDERRPSNRWASLGDQRWLATNARAAAAPDTEGTLETGLPKRRPGANLLPSAATAAANPMSPARSIPARPAAADRSHGDQPGEQDHEQNAQDAAIVRGRLGSYQRGLANARKARSQSSPAPAFDPVGASLFTVNSEAGDNAGRPSGEQGGDQ